MCFPGRICLAFEPLSEENRGRGGGGTVSRCSLRRQINLSCCDYRLGFSLPKLGLLSPRSTHPLSILAARFLGDKSSQVGRVAQSGVTIRSSSTPFLLVSCPFLGRGGREGPRFLNLTREIARFQAACGVEGTGDTVKGSSAVTKGVDRT